MLLSLVEGLEQGSDVSFIRLLRGGEPGLVDAVVDLVVLPFMRLLDLRLELLGVEDYVAVLFVDDVVELEVGA